MINLINFNIELNNEILDFIYDPLTNLIYPDKFSNQYSYLRQKKHPLQRSNFAIKQKKKKVFVGNEQQTPPKLIFDVTDNCNLQCKYCVHNKEYPTKRNYSKSSMSKELLLDILTFYKKNFYHKNINFLDFSFYGGEASLESDIIIFIHKKIKRFFPKTDLSFLLTSNGTFLKNKNLISYIIANDFSLHISLDGPKEENDKFRVYPSGKGSFDDIIKLINSIRNPITILVTLHPDHNWSEIDLFFTKLKEKHKNIKIKVNLFSLQGYNCDNIQIIEKKFENKLDSFQSKIIKKLLYNKKLSYFEESYCNERIEQKFNFIPYWSKKNFVDTCFPGKNRIRVDARGDFYMCERTSDFYSIGNVYKGFDFDKIHVFLKDIVRSSEILNCKYCELQNFCNNCFAFCQNTQNTTANISCNNNSKRLLKKQIVFLDKYYILSNLKKGRNV